MSIVFGVLREVYERLQQLADKYREYIAGLPKGSLQTKTRSGYGYVPLTYRERRKVISKYVGEADSQKVKELLQQVKVRTAYEQKLKQVSHDLKEIERVLYGKSGKPLH